MDGKVFTDQTFDNIVKVVEEGIKLGVIGEMFDGLAAKSVLKVIDHYGDKFIPDNLDDDINNICNLAIAGEWDEAGEAAGLMLDELINLEKVDDAIERIVFVSGMKFVVNLIQSFIKKKQEE